MAAWITEVQLSGAPALSVSGVVVAGGVVIVLSVVGTDVTLVGLLVVDVGWAPAPLDEVSVVTEKDAAAEAVVIVTVLVLDVIVLAEARTVVVVDEAGVNVEEDALLAVTEPVLVRLPASGLAVPTVGKDPTGLAVVLVNKAVPKGVRELERPKTKLTLDSVPPVELVVSGTAEVRLEDLELSVLDARSSTVDVTVVDASGPLAGWPVARVLVVASKGEVVVSFEVASNVVELGVELLFESSPVIVVATVADTLFSDLDTVVEVSWLIGVTPALPNPEVSVVLAIGDVLSDEEVVPPDTVPPELVVSEIIVPEVVASGVEVRGVVPSEGGGSVVLDTEAVPAWVSWGIELVSKVVVDPVISALVSLVVLTLESAVLLAAILVEKGEPVAVKLFREVVWLLIDVPIRLAEMSSLVVVDAALPLTIEPLVVADVSRVVATEVSPVVVLRTLSLADVESPPPSLVVAGLSWLVVAGMSSPSVV